MPKNFDLDAFDLRLLALVRQDNLEPARSLAEKAGLSISSVLRRLRRLRQRGVIVADVAVVNTALTRSALTIHVLARMSAPGRRARDRFSASLRRHPEITGAWEITGDDDFILKVQVGSMQEYDEFVRRALDEENDVHSFKSLIAISTLVEDDPARRPLRLDNV